jgi:peptidoglycan DL-endopeptidase RipA
MSIIEHEFNDVAEIVDAIDAFIPNEKKDLVLGLKNLSKEDIFTPQSHDAIVALVQSEVALFQGDVSTDAGRKEIKDFAFKIAKIRCRIEDAKKEVTADWAERKKNVDNQARLIKLSLEELEAEALQPLTDFQNAEKLRIAEREAVIHEIVNIRNLAILTINDADNQVVILQNNFKSIDFQEFKARAEREFNVTLEYLNQNKARLIEIERQQAELAELKRQADEARQKEHEENIRRQAEEKARKEAEAKAEAEKQAILKAEQEKRDAEIRKQKEDQARIDAERQAKESEAQALIDAERAKAQAEKEALERQLAEQKAEAERLKRDADAKALKEKQESERIETERLAREADLNHRKTINNQIITDLLVHGITDAQAKAIITAIAKGEVSHVKITY